MNGGQGAVEGRLKGCAGWGEARGVWWGEAGGVCRGEVGGVGSRKMEQTQQAQLFAFALSPLHTWSTFLMLEMAPTFVTIGK